MKMRENLQEIKMLLNTNETLLRLLYYKPTNYLDNPLDPAKANILGMQEDARWAIIDDVIKSTEKVTDLDDSVKCRLLFYAGQRKPTNNYLLSNQDVVFDILVHIDRFDEIDMRLSWICDHVNHIIANQQITGIGKSYFLSGTPIATPAGYVGFRMVYSFGSGSL